MDDMTAFERQVARRFQHHAGPIRPVDDAAIFTAITATQSPKWSFASMFSATRFVVAAAIVALFGGLLLAGVITQQPSDGLLPPPAASASASPEVLATATPHQSVRSDLLPGVELLTEDAGPGVYRVLSDGVREVSGRVRSVAVGADGDVWLSLGPERNGGLVRFVQIGVRGRTLAPAGLDGYTALAVTHDGLPVLDRLPGLEGSDVTWILDGQAWAKTELTAYDECVVAATLAGPGTSYRAVGAGGGCWTRAHEVAGAGGDAVLVRVDADGTYTEVTGAELGLESDQGVGHLAVGPDGTVWSTFGRGGRFEPDAGIPNALDGLLAYDGSSWSLIPYDGDGRMAYDALAVDADGVVWSSWLQQTPSHPTRLLSWDGASWIEHPFAVSQGGREPIRIRPWPNGVTWFGAVATRSNGADLEELEPADGWPRPWDANTAIAPDGTTWLVADDQLYVITGEAEGDIVSSAS